MAKRIILDEFIRRANIVHDNRYTYLNSSDNARDKILITCSTHGDFLQIRYDHLKGCGCSRCACSKSKGEIEWLDSLNIPIELRQCPILLGDKLIKADAYDPLTNTIYEYWGDFWHGNPTLYNLEDINSRNKKTFGQLFKETQLKRILILDSGYNLIEIWEDDWNRQTRINSI